MTLIQMLFLFISVLVSLATASDIGYPEVKITDGSVAGSVWKTKNGREFFSFQGIPFAEPPINNLRFKAPVPKKPWDGVWDAKSPHNICPQKKFMFSLENEVIGEEDCLYLNVFTPKFSDKNGELLPVMVFMYGGAFAVGAANFYGPHVLLEKDIVLVVPNYRLGALGFLSTGDDASPGNYGLKDQSLALQWVNKNIKYFGGDPNSVTIFGESAGSASTNFHMYSPLSKGLFHRVISQSGTVFCPWAIAVADEHIKNAKKLAASVGCSSTSNSEAVDCLRHIDAADLVNKDVQFTEWDIEPLIPFKPVIEPPSPQAFLADSPANLVKQKKFQDVPWVLGITKDEGLIRSAAFLRNTTLLQELDDDFDNIIASNFNYKSLVADHHILGQKIRKFYFGNRKLTDEDSFSGISDMYTDALFSSGTDRAIRTHLKVSNSPIYSYVFSYEGESSMSENYFPEKILGSCHCDDLIYLFPNLTNWKSHREESDNDRRISEIMTSLWVNFAKTGIPTPSENDLINAKWDPVKTEKIEYYNIDISDIGMRDALFEERLNLWRNLLTQDKKFHIKEDL